MKLSLRALFISILLFSTNLSFAQSINIDEDFSDWDSVPILYEDATGDNAESTPDFKVLKITNDDRFLYMYLEVGAEINFQSDNSISLLLDLDQNAETGQSFLGIGYEFIFTFGERNGQFYSPSSNSVNPYEIGLIAAPTVTSTVFELKINRDATINGNPIFSSSSFDFLIRSAESNGDLLPDNGSSTLTYAFNDEHIYSTIPYSLKKDSSADLRIMTYNVERDNLFNPSAKDNFRRIFQAIQPDIIGLQEVYNNSGLDAAALIEEFIPTQQEEQWYHGDTGNDNLIVSRYPITDQTSIEGNAAYLLDIGKLKLLAIVAHPPCCTNDSGRQEEIDAFMAFVRDSKNGQYFDIPEFTPIVIMGDMNLVGLARQQTTLITGDISDEGTYGPDFNPDWDRTSFKDLKPNNLESPTSFTWYSSSSSFGAGRLDYMVYSDWVLKPKNSFSLHTPHMHPDSLEVYGLESDDTILASDHLPVVGDFQISIIASSENDSYVPEDFDLHQNYPNPFNPSTIIGFQLVKGSSVKLEVFDALGRKVETLFNGYKSVGTHMVTFDAKSLPSGLYYYALTANGVSTSQKMMLIK